MGNPDRPKFNEKFPELASHDIGGAKYSLIECSSQKSYRSVRVDVPKEVDLSNDSVAKSILEEAAHYAQKKCPKEEPFGNIAIKICYPGEKFRMASVSARNYDGNKFTWREYWNKPLQKRLKQEKKEAREKAREEKRRKEEEKRRKELAARKAKEDQERAAANKRLDNFIKKYGVTDWPAMKKFSVNPFIYEGKKVAFVSEFGTMLSATEGRFESDGEFFIVSDIPKGFFSKEAEVVIAGRPLGKKETKIPLFGEVLVPNLNFIGVYFCEERNCRDIVWE